MDTRDFDDFTSNGEKPQGIEPNGFQEGSVLPDHAQPPMPPYHPDEEARKISPWLRHKGPLHPIPFEPHQQFGRWPPLPLPPPHPGRGQLLLGQNSLILETLFVISGEIHDIDEIAKIIKEIGPEAISLFEKIRALNVTEDPKLFIQLMIAEEQLERAKTRAVMVDYIMSRKAIVLLPLPPYLLDSLKASLVPELVFETEKRVQAHIKHITFRNLNMNTLAEAIEQVDEIEALIMDGQSNMNELLIRDNTAPLIKIMFEKQLKRIFLHKIPHLPREEFFVRLSLSTNEVEVTSI